MFEGLVRQLILGYLGQYIKDIHREQLKITLWNEEVLLENVELMLEAFDYLELPFALKQGRVGRLSIRIPWKKLGWDPIIIILEDILVCASQREDEEWSTDAVERREFAGKKAKLATAELAKLSQRVCDNQTGSSFISYITAKIIDGIQVSIRNVQVVYGDISNDKEQTVFGLKLASLTAMKQNLTGISSGKVRIGQVNKLVEIKGLEVYCRTFGGSTNDLYTDNGEDSMSMVVASFQSDEHIHLLAPVDVSASISVNRSGQLENNAAQYSIDVELSGLELSLNEDQLQQILYLSDYLCTCRLREKYGRYRPRGSPLSERPVGWQIQWWHYAQQSVLADVQKRLKRTSWRYLGEQIGKKRRYVNLYKLKLECLQKEEPLDDAIVMELDQMEKSSDLDDILSYRSAAEKELQEYLVGSISGVGVNEANTSFEKSVDDDQPQGKAQGWLKWLSRGMLGAGGTDDSSQFSGVVSDEVIKDIYEATKFHPAPSSVLDAGGSDGILLSSIKFSIRQISATLRNKKLGRAIAELVLEGNLMECMIWEKSVVVTASINAVEMMNSLNEHAIILVRRVVSEEHFIKIDKPSLNIQAYIPKENQEVELTLKVLLEPIEVTFDPTFILNIMEFNTVLNSLTSHEERVLKSLNGINDVKSRLISKAEYILSSRKRMKLDFSLINVKIVIPWENEKSEMHKLVLGITAITFTSKRDIGCFAPDINVPSQFVRNLIDIDSSDVLKGIQIQDLHDHFEIKLSDLEINLVVPHYPYTYPIMEKLDVSSALARCIVQDEPSLKALEVYVVVTTLLTHLSPSIIGAVLELVESFNMLHHTSHLGTTSTISSYDMGGFNKSKNLRTSRISVIANLESASVIVDLENGLDASCTLTASLQDLDVRFVLKESTKACWMCTRALRVTFRSLNSADDLVLCLSENNFSAQSSQHNEDDLNSSPNGCLMLHYDGDLVKQRFSIWLSDVDLHCYPYVIGLLVGFFDKISEYSPPDAVKNQDFLGSNGMLSGSYFDFQRFGCSNIYETSSADWESISVDHYPFVTIYNDSPLVNLETSLINISPDWKKAVNIRRSKINSSKFSAKKEFQKLYTPLVVTHDISLPSNPDQGGLVVVNLHLSNIRLHFHDSKCIVASATLPAAKSFIAIHKDYLDVFSSTEGLVISSYWCPQPVQDSLWGPASPNLSPVFNMRVKKRNIESVGGGPCIELDFSIQNVSCILPPEFLAVLIGYFSLPDWYSNTKESPAEDNISLTYKFEILDSILFAPVVNVVNQFLKLDIPQMYCTYIDKCDLVTLLRGIPAECCVPNEFIVDHNHCLNLFGRGLSLHHLLLKDNAYDSLKFNCVIERSARLIEPFSGDVWIRIPYEPNTLCSSSSSSSVCVMSRISDCQVIAEGNDILGCFGAFVDVIDEFSSVKDVSRHYTSDVLQFLQSKRSAKENQVPPTESSAATLTEIRCCIQSMSAKLYSQQQIEYIGSELIAKADMKFTCAVSLRNDQLLCLDISFTSLTLSSLSTSVVVLVECTTSSRESLPVLQLNVLMSNEGENQLRFSLPCANIWLHLSEWSKVIDFLSSSCLQLPNTAIRDEVPKKSTVDPSDFSTTPENTSPSNSVSSYRSSEGLAHHPSLIVKSNHIGIKICVPIEISGEFRFFGAPQIREHNSLNDYSCLFIYLQSRCTEVNVNGKNASMTSNIGKMTGTVELCRNKSVHSWPIFQLLQVNAGVDIGNDQMEHMHFKGDIQCDNLDIWLSHDIFYLWQTMHFVFPEEAGSSKSPVYEVNLRFHLRKLSILLTEQKWSSSGPLLEIIMGSLLFNGVMTENLLEGSVDSELQVNYNNIHKVLWEPFVEPWKFQVSLRREHGKSALENSPVLTDIHLESIMSLNINVTESFIEVAFRASDMIKDAWALMEMSVLSENSRLPGTGTNEKAVTGRYAPYTLENLTSLPLVFYIFKGSKNSDGFEVSSSLKDGKYVQPGSSYPVYIDNTTEEQTFRFSTSHSSDNLSERQPANAQHHYMMFQLEGTSTLSAPISIDLVGVTSFEVDFSNTGVDSGRDISKGFKEFEGSKRQYTSSSYVVPVIIDVSVQRYTKLVRLYSTVILLNATSVPFELRFDIPFGVSPKILDPVYPGREFPLPLHLAETGRIRWRPLGSTYLWSEAYSISNILSNDIKIGYLRSFVCYPSLPSSDPFRCCVSVHDMCLPSVGRINKGSSLNNNAPHDTSKQAVEKNKSDKIQNHGHSRKCCIHLITLSNPLIVKNYLPITVSLIIESGGVTRSMLLSEVENSFYHIDSSHDLTLTIHIDGFRPSSLKFPRAEKFSEIAKFSGTKFSSSESINFSGDNSKGPLYVTMEKVMDAYSGAREICIFVPFLLYNCCGFPLVIANSTNERIATHGCTVPSCYDLDEQDLFVGQKDGLGLLSSNHLLHTDGNGNGNGMRRLPLNNNLVSTRKCLEAYHGKLLKEPFNSSGPSGNEIIGSQNSSLHDKENGSVSTSQINVKQVDFDEKNRKKVNFCMYSPDPNLLSSEIMVRVRRGQSDIDVESISDYAWSNQFFLVPPTGSTTVLVPKASSNASYLISAASSAIDGPFSGKTRIINFQPRYVISNACSKDLCYRQKGSDLIYHLKVGQHSHIHWTDTSRELLVSVRFDEPGWQWSGCFIPEHFGDTQLKMRNYVSGAVNMVRVEVQNADDAIKDDKVFGNPHGDSGTNLVLLSDDDTGFMPYRIDNFSKERLRIYQQKCEAVETVVHSYTSCPYAWDEPCYPHRLTVEVFAERVIGSYTLDDAKEYKPVYLPATSEKPERKLLLSVHAEGALKVLSVIDSSYHSFDDIKTQQSPRLNDKREYDQRQETSVPYLEKLSVAIPFIGISVMSSQPQELLFACARNTMIDLVQSLDQQKFSLKIFALQIDNQLPTTPYPVILSFDHEYKKTPAASQIEDKDHTSRVRGERMKQLISDSSIEPVFSLAAAKWRNKDRALLSFEHINLRMTDFHLELEQDVILGLFDLFKTVSSRFLHSRAMADVDSVLHPLSSNFSVNMTSKVFEAHQSEKADGDFMFVEGNNQSQGFPLLPSIVPIGAPWQKICLLARKQKKIYVEVLEVAPVTLTLSFSSSPWMLRNGVLTSGEYLIHRGLMALADVEGARIHLRQLTISHQLASLESIREILIIHYTRQLLHEMYKVFGSAGVIGNPMGFARSVGLGIKDFLSVPARSFMQSPAGLITGMAQGTTSLLSNTVYAISDAATQVSKAAHKGIVAFTMDDPTTMELERQQKGMSSHGKGVINELLEGLTGLLQSPIRGAEKHGLPGVLSGIALGVTGLVARPAASILEVTEKTARSIRNRSKLYHMGSQRLRVRLPRPLSRDYPLRPYLWEEAVGVSVLANADDTLMLKDETLVLSKPLKEGGKFVIITERLFMIVSCPSLVNLGKPDFRGVPADPDWIIDAEITLDSVIHVDTVEEVVHIVGSSSDVVLRQNQSQQKRGAGHSGKQRWYHPPTPLPLFQTNLECSCKGEALDLLKVLLATIEKGKERGWGCVYRLHRSNIR
ncbi:intermembrane lipid transfer protein VPS13 [Rutidosis leptorrhynchoides]|uniref:intermembrane lipid transfer protein VPS13 n=1 Tax=Rutidosis leptorrhynchoides TaxID=125765 RepID=UPI003A9A49D2